MKTRSAKAMLIAIFALISSTLSAVPAAALELLMVDQEGCVYCEMWDEEISEIYPKTAEGRFAPLARIDISQLDDADVTFARPINFTPTFVLLEDGRELGRIEGYPGEDLFWWMLGKLLSDNTAFDGAGG